MSATPKSVILNPTQWILEIPEKIHQAALQASSASARSSAEWHRYLARVASQTLVEILQEEGEAVAINTAEIEPFSQLNQWIPGAAIDWSGKRCVLLPSTSLDESEVLIPQEWLDIPGWQGDYFLAVQVDPDERSLTVLGYATHRRVKQLAEYAASERTYRLDATYLIQDLNTLSVARQLCPDEVTQAEVTPIPVLTASEVSQWLEQLQTCLNPRLAVPFQTWAGLVMQPDALATLAGETSMVKSAIDTAATTLSRWFEGVVEQGWQTLDSLMDINLAPAYALRDGGPDVRETLRRARVIQLSESDSFLLVLEAASIEDGRLSVRIQLYPASRESSLPPHVALTLQTVDGEMIQTVSSRAQDDLIQLKRFRCPDGFQFVVRIALGDDALDVPFVV